MNPPGGHEGWTVESYAAHNEALRLAEERLQAERDRRYAEVALEREKAIKIKDAADEEAMRIRRAQEAYREDHDNRFREQLKDERLTYATKTDLVAFREQYEIAHKPLADYVLASRASEITRTESKQSTFASIDMSAKIFGVVVAAFLLWFGYQSAHRPTVDVTPHVQTVTVRAP
jgi:hypothetical protein